MKPITETEFQDLVLKLALMFGWRRAHFRPAETKKGWRTAVSGDGKGFPDLLLIRGKTLIVAELKRSRKEVPTPEQEAWLAAFRGAGIPAYLWTPEDWSTIEGVLR